MAQLSEDAFAFGGKLATVAEAVQAVFDRVAPVPETDEVGLSEARGRVLARDLVAPVPIPGFDNSAVDGYAVRIADVAAEGMTRLEIIDRVIAGAAALVPLGPRQAIRVFTGAPLPPGADTVYMQEDVTREGDTVVVPAGLKRGANARFKGEDLTRGAVAIAAGRRLRAEDIGLAAALGIPALVVRRRLVVALFSTGNEVIEPGQALPPAGLYDANRPLLAALIEGAGARTIDLGILRDDQDMLADGFARAARAGADVIVTSGGVSTGEEDHVKAAVERAGRLDWWRVGIKPGRPVAMGVVGGAAFLGLPGNPVAAYVTFTQIVRPLLAALSGESWRAPRAFPVICGFPYKKKTGRREFVRVSLATDADGRLVASKHAQDGAGVITSLTMTDGLLDLPEDVTRVDAGQIVGFVPFGLLD
jgi:molybdopterin molybdotransferase